MKYRASVIPVGEDQVQHIELARSLGNRMNRLHKTDLVIPQAQLCMALHVMTRLC